MVLSNAERQRRYREKLKARAELQPEAVAETLRSWVIAALADWDEIQPEAESWKSHVSNQKTPGDALRELYALTDLENAGTDAQRTRFASLRLIMDALTLRGGTS